MRFKIVAFILLILSIFSFVLAVPVPVREVRNVYTDAVEGDENVIIVSGKRVPRGNLNEGVESGTVLGTPPPQSSSAPDYASGSHPGVDMPSSPSGGAESPQLPPPPGREGYLAKVAGQQSPSSSITSEHVSPWNYFEPSPPRKPQSKGFVSIIKTYFGKLTKLLGKLRFWPRF